MGHNSSRGNEQVLISLNHPKFQNSKICRKFNSEALKTTLFADEKAYKQWRDSLSKNKLSHQCLLLPIDHKYKADGLCASKGSVQITYDNYPYLLTDEIHNRKGKKAIFSQPQLWYLLYSTLSAKHYLAEKTANEDAIVGDIQPQNVFLNENGNVKLASVHSWPGEKNNYQKSFEGDVGYLAPEDIDLRELGLMNNQKNYASEDFSIGLMLVSAGILKDNLDLYSPSDQRMNQHEATKRINAFKCSSVYSELLRGVVGGFCVFDPKVRLSHIDAWAWISRYETRIISKQSFMVEEVPEAVNLHLNRLRAELSNLNPEGSTFSIRSLRSSNHRSGANSFKSKDANRNAVQNQFQNSRPVNFYQSPPIQGYMSPPSRIGLPQQIHALKSPQKNLNYQPNQVIRSPEGYYSPKNVTNNAKPFRVFIQYKSPTRPLEAKIQNQVTINNQIDNEKTDKGKGREIDNQSQKSDKKSSKSGSSDRKNRFVEATVQQVFRNNKQSVNSEKPSKKESPINQVIEPEVVYKEQQVKEVFNVEPEVVEAEESDFHNENAHQTESEIVHEFKSSQDVEGKQKEAFEMLLAAKNSANQPVTSEELPGNQNDNNVSQHVTYQSHDLQSGQDESTQNYQQTQNTQNVHLQASESNRALLSQHDQRPSIPENNLSKLSDPNSKKSENSNFWISYDAPSENNAQIPVYHGGATENYYKDIDLDFNNRVRVSNREKQEAESAREQAERVQQIIAQKFAEAAQVQMEKKDQRDIEAYEATYVPGKNVVAPQQMDMEPLNAAYNADDLQNQEGDVSDHGFTSEIPMTERHQSQQNQDTVEAIKFDTPSSSDGPENRVETYEAANRGGYEAAIDLESRSIEREQRDDEMLQEQQRTRDEAAKRIAENLEIENKEAAQNQEAQHPNQQQAGQELELAVHQAIFNVSRQSESPDGLQQNQVSEGKYIEVHGNHQGSSNDSPKDTKFDDGNILIEDEGSHTEGGIGQSGGYERGMERKPIPIGPQENRREAVVDIATQEALVHKDSESLSSYPEGRVVAEGHAVSHNDDMNPGTTVKQHLTYETYQQSAEITEEKQSGQEIKITIRGQTEQQRQRSENNSNEAVLEESSGIAGSGQMHSRYIEESNVSSANSNPNNQNVLEEIQETMQEQKASHLHDEAADIGAQNTERYEQMAGNAQGQTQRHQPIENSEGATGQHVQQEFNQQNQSNEQSIPEGGKQINAEGLVDAEGNVVYERYYENGQLVHENIRGGEHTDEKAEIQAEQADNGSEDQNKAALQLDKVSKQDGLLKEVIDMNAQINQSHPNNSLDHSLSHNNGSYAQESSHSELNNSQMQFTKVQEVIGTSKELQRESRQTQYQEIPEQSGRLEETMRKQNLLQTEQNETIGNHPTSSEFGNISEIMDINKQFANSLNARDEERLNPSSSQNNNNILGFLLESSAGGGSSEGRNEQIVQELIKMSEKGEISERDLDRIPTGHITQEDRERIQLVFSRQGHGRHSPSRSADSVDHTRSENVSADKVRLQNPVYDESKVDIKYSELKTEHAIIPEEVTEVNENQRCSSDSKDQTENLDRVSVEPNYGGSQTSESPGLKFGEVRGVSSRSEHTEGINLSNTAVINEPTPKGDIIDEVKLINQSINQHRPQFDQIDEKVEHIEQKSEGALREEVEKQAEQDFEQISSNNKYRAHSQDYSHAYSEPNQTNHGNARQNAVQEQITEEAHEDPAQSKDQNQVSNSQENLSQGRNKGDIVDQAIGINRQLNNKISQKAEIFESSNGTRVIHYAYEEKVEQSVEDKAGEGVMNDIIEEVVEINKEIEGQTQEGQER